jgi:hypothetical protein
MLALLIAITRVGAGRALTRRTSARLPNGTVVLLAMLAGLTMLAGATL